MTDHEQYPDDTAAVIAGADLQGLRVVIPAENELQIDIDSETKYMEFSQIWGMFRAITEAEIISDQPSRHGLPKRHITIQLPNSVTELERLFLQTVLGSDNRRELFGYRRTLMGTTPVTMFLELKHG